MAPTNRQPRGWTWPGHNYLGPFNPLDAGEPTSPADTAAKKHDEGYDQLIKEGHNPYLKFNKFDQILIDDLKSDFSWAGFAAKGFFTLKKHLAPALGDKPSTSGTQTRAQKRKLYFARSNKGAKQPKMGDANADAATGGEEGGQAIPRGPGGAGGGQGGGGAGMSVGISTGGWSGGSTFRDNIVITRSTRQWFTPILNETKYKIHDPRSQQNATSGDWIGISTPWAFFNFNNYASHFSPQDWQRLTNEYKRWRPKAMRVKIYNLQIKQIVKLGEDTLYNNDLTAGVHIFCDGSHEFPYAQHTWDESYMPEFPNKIWQLSQYAYYQISQYIQSQQTTTVNRSIRQNKPLYLLESASHEVLRTGEGTQFEFEFKSGWVHNDRAYGPPQGEFNALVNSTRFFPVLSASTGVRTYTRYAPYNKPSNWVPGPSMDWSGHQSTSDNPGKNRGPIVMTLQPPASASRDYTSDAGRPIPNDTQIANNGYSSDPVNAACSTMDATTLSYDSSHHSRADNNVTQRAFDIDMTRYNTVHGLHTTRDNNQVTETNTRFRNMFMYPNQAWNSTPICRANPIWQKTPRCDNLTLQDSSDGTLDMEHPPGSIFVKVAKIPIPGAPGEDSYLNLYVTGQVTCEIAWEVERYATKNWRPELRNSAGHFSDYEAFNVTETGDYNTPVGFTENMPTRRGLNRVL